MVKLICFRHFQPLERMPRNDDSHIRVILGEVAYDQLRLLLVVTEECEVPVRIEAVRRIVAIAQIIDSALA